MPVLQLSALRKLDYDRLSTIRRIVSTVPLLLMESTFTQLIWNITGLQLTSRSTWPLSLFWPFIFFFFFKSTPKSFIGVGLQGEGPRWHCFPSPVAWSHGAAQMSWRRAQCTRPQMLHLPRRWAPQWLGPEAMLSGWWSHPCPRSCHHPEAVILIQLGGCPRQCASAWTWCSTPWHPWRWWFCSTGSWRTRPGGGEPVWAPFILKLSHL